MSIAKSRHIPKVVHQVADRLFVNGSGHVAERLVLTSSDGKDLGGWCKGAVLDHLLELYEKARKDATR